MRVIRSFFIAVAMYSKIPVPQFAWNEEDMRYVFCFFPWIGAWIGACIYFWNQLCSSFQIGTLGRVAVSAAIPLWITGGIHADGFIDTMDAVHSYCSKERKLEILKDPHIGAFAAIMAALYGLLFLGAFSEIHEQALLKIVCGGFFLSRCLCGISAVSFPLAKSDGMLWRFADSSDQKAVKGCLYVQSAACAWVFCCWSVPAGLAVSAAAAAAFIFYYYKSRNVFGGVTGDTAGYFILFCEGCMVAVAACMELMAGRIR
ncbi:MAG: adenosylcobinamide-GDP ribazoletransferase [Eubacterium sp.]|nr:adenosylcobinamide-GDP ribazoletransferase [Eubacterium sp.]